MKKPTLLLIVSDFYKEIKNKVQGKPNKLYPLSFFVSIYLHKLMNNILKTIPGTTININSKKIKQYKNKHSGDRCFIIGSGPSLDKKDLERIKNEKTFAVNHIYHIFKETDWRPTYYYSQEINLRNGGFYYNDLMNCEYSSEIPLAFFPINSNMKDLSKKWNCIFLPVYMDYCEFSMTPVENFSKDCSKEIVHAYTSLYSVLQLAVYMGFTEIYLLGVDAKYLPNKIHFYEPDEMESKIFCDEIIIQNISQIVTKGFEGMKNAETKIGTFKIFNCTRGGYLELFPRKELEEILGKRD